MFIEVGGKVPIICYRKPAVRDGRTMGIDSLREAESGQKLVFGKDGFDTRTKATQLERIQIIDGMSKYSTEGRAHVGIEPGAGGEIHINGIGNIGIQAARDANLAKLTWLLRISPIVTFSYSMLRTV